MPIGRAELWLARAYYHLGESVDPGSPLNPPRQRPITKRRWPHMTCCCGTDGLGDQPPSATSVLAARKQQADCYRRLRRYDKAIAGYAELLAQKPMMLDVQQTAAATYQEWGDLDRSKFNNAIAGGHPGPKGENIIFGWAKLARLAARMAARKPEYKALYFEGWLQVAKTRLCGGDGGPGVGEEEQLRQAKRSIRTMYQLYPDLGGDASRCNLSRVLMQIQRALKEKPVGLRFE